MLSGERSAMDNNNKAATQASWEENNNFMPLTWDNSFDLEHNARGSERRVRVQSATLNSHSDYTTSHRRRQWWTGFKLKEERNVILAFFPRQETVEYWKWKLATKFDSNRSIYSVLLTNFSFLTFEHASKLIQRPIPPWFKWGRLDGAPPHSTGFRYNFFAWHDVTSLVMASLSHLGPPSWTSLLSPKVKKKKLIAKYPKIWLERESKGHWFAMLFKKTKKNRMIC